MKTKHGLGVGLLVGAGIVVATVIVLLAADSGWWAMSGPLVLALTVVAADMVAAREERDSSGPSPSALVLGGSFLLAGLIVTLSDPALVKVLIPIMGAGSFVGIRQYSDGRRGPCRAT